MFEYIKLKNYKSFKDVELNLLDRRNNPKKLILIYGENGIGKSNIASAFFMLSETLRTMDVRDLMESLLSENSDNVFKNVEELKKYFQARYKDIETLINENKTISSVEPMYMEFGFRLMGKSGRYILETNNSQIIHEQLEYTISKNRGIYFDITCNKQIINNNIFLDKTSYRSIKEACLKFWGKHSLLSILLHESDDKSEQYIKQRLIKNFNIILNFFSKISCKVKLGNSQEQGIIGLPREILSNYDNGEISIKKEKILDNTEKMLNILFKLTYQGIKKVYYKKTINNNLIHYKLFLSKMIAGKVRDIDFSLESTGTQSIIQQLPFMLVATKGAVAIIDEFDMGIHDLLLKNLITSLYNDIGGQLIITTHNTILMESNIPKECIYVINESAANNKEIKCILYYNNKIGNKNNIRNQYLLGRYSGIPDNVDINFHKLLEILTETK